ncbi:MULTISPECIES: hypothetical protein [Enterococcus]|uniref:Methanol dehydrogenase n=1 Tax=Enterococcus alishanensis TaxID=1303817 RepID=A0ABS6TGI3_9ENTE|nr:hypothetical protein [Enterococcus alishanensis]MBV7392043.1 hypothetical protein [Enterococcus alishanensis]
MKIKKIVVITGIVLGLGAASQIVEHSVDKTAVKNYVETNFTEQDDNETNFNFKDEEENTFFE